MARTQKANIGSFDVSPGDVTTVGVDWRPKLSTTADTILDFDGHVEGLPTLDSWFSETHTCLKFGPAVQGQFIAKFDIEGESGEKFHREVKIRCR